MRTLMPILVPACAFVAGAVQADVFSWNNPAGGAFHDPANWNDGFDGTPGPTDTLLFDLDAAFNVLPAQGEPVTHQFLVVRRGSPTLLAFDSNLDFEFSGTGSAAPSVVLADMPDANATLRFQDAGGASTLDLRLAGVRVATALDSTGTWVHLGAQRRVEAGDVHVGWLGDGHAFFGEGATIAMGRLQLAGATSASGTMEIAGPGTTVEAGAVDVGVGGAGAVEILDGAELHATGALVGHATTAVGSVLVDGAGSSLLLDQGLDVGWFGDGLVEARAGAGIAAFGAVTVGGFAHDDPPSTWAHGTLRLGADATLFVGASLYLGLGGDAALECIGDGSAWILGDVLSFSDGTAGAARLEVRIVDPDDYVGAPAVFASGHASLPLVSVRFDGPDAPSVGTVHRLVRALGGAEVGAFDLVAPPGLRLEPIVDGTNVDVRVGLLADLDGDDSVGFADLTLLLASWGACAAPPAECIADLDGDGTVDFADLVMLLAQWSGTP